jgi:hypothetical protein
MTQQNDNDNQQQQQYHQQQEDNRHRQPSQTEYDEASAEIEQLLGATKPKHIVHGLSSGVEYILRGAVGACGAVVVSSSIDWMG